MSSSEGGQRGLKTGGERSGREGMRLTGREVWYGVDARSGRQVGRGWERALGSTVEVSS